MRRRLVWLGVPLSLLVVGSQLGCSRWRGQLSDPVGVNLSTVTVGIVEDSINQIGTVKLNQQQVIQSAIAGRVDQVFVDIGDRVTTGQPLLLLQDDTWEPRQREQELEIQQQEINLIKSQQAIATAEVELQDTKATLSENENLFEQGYIPRDELDESRHSVRQAEVALQTARLDLEQATLEMQSLRIEAQTLAKEQQAKQILSPGNAIILDIVVQRGAVVDISTDLMVLGDPSRELVYLQLPPLRAQQVKPLQKARVRPLGPDTTVYAATVRDVARLANTNNDEGDGNGQPANLGVIVALDIPSQTLIPGTQVSVDIIPEQRSDVLKVEAGAIQQSQDGPFVWVVDANKTAQKQPITVGLAGLTEVEVIQGLKAGDQVVVRPDSPLTEGMAVQVREESLTPPQ